MGSTARLKIEPGVRYGKYLVSIEEVPSTGQGQIWRFRCDCGNETVKRVSRVKSGVVVSCGRCNLGRLGRNLRHGHTVRKGKKGKERFSPEYISWQGMKARCSNPKQPNWRWYGGRGVAVCERWMGSFEAFLADMGLKPSPKHILVRIAADSNYEPGNCRWATRVGQPKNRRLAPKALRPVLAMH
jgi:hypothetical protein